MSLPPQDDSNNVTIQALWKSINYLSGRSSKRGEKPPENNLAFPEEWEKRGGLIHKQATAEIPREWARGRGQGSLGALTREGLVFNQREIDAWVVKWDWAATTEVGFMNLAAQLGEQYEQVVALWAGYKERCDGFRGQIKNDAASLEAQARKTVEASNKMRAAFAGVMEDLNSEDMKTAIENAERLAAALTLLNQLKSHRVMFATVDAKQTSENEAT